MSKSSRILFTALAAALLINLSATMVHALNGGTRRVNPSNDWQAFEIISINDNPSGDGFDWSMPGTFDGLGAWLPDDSTLRLQVNHERSDATISEVNLDLAAFETAITNTITSGTPGTNFVNSARQAYDRWSDDGGATWTNTSDTTSTSFHRFCSGQSYAPNTFGDGRGFVDHVYMTGEESFSNFSTGNRLFALDLENRDFYQVSDVAGSAAGGLGGMPRDSWENVALVDTGETDHVAILLSPDGGTERMKIYIGEKGKDADGNPANSFLARNGLAYGSYYYLNDSLPSSGTSVNGFFDTTTDGALRSSKLEDVDTSPGDPSQVLLGDQNSGVFTFDLDLDFSSGSFSAAGSGFSITKIHNHVDATNGSIGDADNVEWIAPTVLGEVAYPDGLVFINEDFTTGEIWMSEPDGSNPVLIGDTGTTSSATESSGILDISALVGYNPGSVLLTSNQGSNASLTALINPDATPATVDVDFDNDGDVDGQDFLTWQREFADAIDLATWQEQYGSSSAIATASVPEPSSWTLAACAFAWVCRRPRR